MVIGWILIVIGFFVTLSGVILLILFGSGSAVTSTVNRLSTTTPALVADLGNIEDASGARRWLGQPTLLINRPSPSEKPTFIGVGPQADVNRYLDGIAHDQVTDFNLSPFSMALERQDGTDRAAPPGQQSFWVATLPPGSSNLSWPFQDGRYSVVVMNADGSAVVDTQVSVGISIPDSNRLWILIIVIGGVLLIGGIVLVVVGAGRRRPPASEQPGPYATAGPPQ